MQKAVNRGTSVNLDTRDENPRPPLVIALTFGWLPATRWLLEHEANVNVINLEGRTPLMESSNRGYLDEVKLLLEFKADISIRVKRGTDAGKTALDLAYHQDGRIISLLKEGLAIVATPTAPPAPNPLGGDVGAAGSLGGVAGLVVGSMDTVESVPGDSPLMVDEANAARELALAVETEQQRRLNTNSAA